MSVSFYVLFAECPQLWIWLTSFPPETSPLWFVGGRKGRKKPFSPFYTNSTLQAGTYLAHTDLDRLAEAAGSQWPGPPGGGSLCPVSPLQSVFPKLLHTLFHSISLKGSCYVPLCLGSCDFWVTSLKAECLNKCFHFLLWGRCVFPPTYVFVQWLVYIRRASILNTLVWCSNCSTFGQWTLFSRLLGVPDTLYLLTSNPCQPRAQKYICMYICIYNTSMNSETSVSISTCNHLHLRNQTWTHSNLFDANPPPATGICKFLCFHHLQSTRPTVDTQRHQNLTRPLDHTAQWLLLLLTLGAFPHSQCYLGQRFLPSFPIKLFHILQYKYNF